PQRRQGLAAVPEKVVEQLVLAHPRGAQQEKVVAVVAHVEAKAQGLGGALLAEVILQGLEVVGGGEGQLPRLAGAVELAWQQRLAEIPGLGIVVVLAHRSSSAWVNVVMASVDHGETLPGAQGTPDAPDQLAALSRPSSRGVGR